LGEDSRYYLNNYSLIHISEFNPPISGSLKEVEYYINKTDIGIIRKPDAFADYTGPFGNSMILFLIIEDDVIEDAKFQYKGCAGAACCGSALCSLLKGKTIQEANRITHENLINHLGATPNDEFDCPLLVTRTLKKPIRRYQKRS